MVGTREHHAIADEMVIKAVIGIRPPLRVRGTVAGKSNIMATVEAYPAHNGHITSWLNELDHKIRHPTPSVMATAFLSFAPLSYSHVRSSHAQQPWRETKR